MSFGVSECLRAKIIWGLGGFVVCFSLFAVVLLKICLRSRVLGFLGL